MKPSDHNRWQKEGSGSGFFSEVVERFNPFTSPEEKAAYFHGAVNKPKKRSFNESEGSSGAAGGGGDFLGGLLGATWILWVVPTLMLGLILLTVFPVIWLAWRVFHRKSGPANNKFVGTGWTILGGFFAWFGLTTLGTWGFVKLINWNASWQEIGSYLAAVHQRSIGESIGWMVLGVISISLPLSALIGGLDLLRQNRAVVTLAVVIVLAAASGANYYLSHSAGRNPALANTQSLKNVKYPFTESMGGQALGLPSGVLWDAHGAEFSADRASRIEYPGAVPPEGTIEFRINVKRGYRYDDFKFLQSPFEAMVFSTDAQGGDVSWPGAAKIFVRSDGDVVLTMAVAKYDKPASIPTVAHHTSFRFNSWHTIGVSYGMQGQYIMVDGKLSAAAPAQVQTLGAAGDQVRSDDVPTIGETVSHFWAHHRYEGGFEGTLGSFRVSTVQRDWSLAKKAR